MTDRELLEAAAKAAGLDGWTYSPEDNAMRSPPRETSYGPGCSYWAPLTDDGDALRLAVKLNLTVTPEGDEHWASAATRDESDIGYVPVSVMDGDRAAAVRRAIVVCAATIAVGVELPEPARD